MSKTNATLNSFYNVNSSTICLKPYSSMLPYRVIEALSSSNISNVTTRVSESGWTWFVNGRKLFIWRHVDDVNSASGGRARAPKCYELLLPPSDIAHRAELVCVVGTLQHRNCFPAALAVSPEGSIRYWPNISQGNNTIDSIVTADLQGQECLTLVDIQPLGCILGTTTNSLVHICVEPNQDEHNQSPIVCRTLKAPQGILSGIGRKVSSLIFGAVPATQQSESKQLVRIVRNPILSDVDDVVPLFILALSNCIIQKWVIEDYDQENFEGEIDLEKHLKEAFINKLWNPALTHHNQLSIRPLDIALKGNDDIHLLVMCTNADISNESFFGLFTFSANIFNSNVNDQSISCIFISFRLVPNFCLAQTFGEANRGSRHKLFPSIISGDSGDEQVCYVYNSSKMYRINLFSEESHSESLLEIDFQLSNDYLLGAVLYRQTPLLLTFKNGFISLHSFHLDSRDNKQISSTDREFVTVNNTDKFTVFRRALTLYAKGEQTRGKLMVQEMFPLIVSRDARPIGNSCQLDDVVCSVSADICNQVPQTDPRWAHVSHDENNLAGNSLSCVIIANQLEEKLLTHRTFIELLQQSGAWDALSSLTASGAIIPSKLILLEHIEKLLVCLALRKLHTRYGRHLENAIRKVMERRQSSMLDSVEGSHLTHQDLFYQQVTKVDDLFWQLIEDEESKLCEDRSHLPEDSFNLVLSVTDIIVNTFAEVCLYRQSNGSIYQSAVISDCDYVPWASDEHVSGVRDTWIKQFDLLIKHSGVDHLSTDEARCSLVSQKLVALADIILDSFVCQLSYLNVNNEKYSILKSTFETNRYKYLMPLLRLRQYEQVASLAEKYEDFDILIQLCDELNNQEQLQQYVQQFASKGFSEYLFEWYLKEGKQGKMLATVSNNQKLSDFLSKHQSLNWLHQIHLGQFKEASQTLKRLGTIEENIPARKKTLLSIGKLALIASGDQNSVDFDNQITLLNYQSGLSDALLSKNNLNQKPLKVLSPEQLVDILISGVQGPNEDMDNFHKALEIAELVEKRYSLELYRQISQKIWLKAFLKDSWSRYSTDNYESPIKESFFYQLAFSYFGDESKKLPHIESMVSKMDEKLAFFLRATYELIYR